MSAELYPAEVWERFSNPQWVLAAELDAAEVCRARTPASAEMAVLFRAANRRWYWRAHASPWLVAVLEVLCAGLNTSITEAALDEALNKLTLPPVKRYCRAMASELWQASAQA